MYLLNVMYLRFAPSFPLQSLGIFQEELDQFSERLMEKLAAERDDRCKCTLM